MSKLYITESVEVPSVTITSSSGHTATTSSSPASPAASPSTLQPSNHRRKKPKRRSTGVVNLEVDVSFWLICLFLMIVVYYFSWIQMKSFLSKCQDTTIIWKNDLLLFIRSRKIFLLLDMYKYYRGKYLRYHQSQSMNYSHLVSMRHPVVKETLCFLTHNRFSFWWPSFTPFTKYNNCVSFG